MADYRGQDGYVSLGGILVGSPQLKGALAESATQMDIDGGGSALTGIVAVGDTFTIAGEAGSPTHTVTAPTGGGTFYVASGNEVLDINFTPAIAAGGAADNAAVTFASNSVAQVRSWSMDHAIDVIDTTVKGQHHQNVRGGIVRWTGQVVCLLDYGDAEQAELIAKLATATPVETAAALVLGVVTKKQWYVPAMLSGYAPDSPEGSSVVAVSFNFVADSAALVDWTA